MQKRKRWRKIQSKTRETPIKRKSENKCVCVWKIEQCAARETSKINAFNAPSFCYSSSQIKYLTLGHTRLLFSYLFHTHLNNQNRNKKLTYYSEEIRGMSTIYITQLTEDFSLNGKIFIE